MIDVHYYRSGRAQRIVHVEGCVCVNRIARLMRRVRPWRWADEQSASRIAQMIQTLHLRPCRACRPFTRGELR